MNIELIITITLMLVCLFLVFKYKREYLQVIAYYAVVQAEDYYKNGHGKEKLKMAIKEVKGRLPFYISWLVSENVITGLIENALETLQTQFKDSKIRQIESLDSIIEVGLKTNDVATVVTKAEEIKNGYIEGYAEARTDFRGNSSGVVGVKAGLKL